MDPDYNRNCQVADKMKKRKYLIILVCLSLLLVGSQEFLYEKTPLRQFSSGIFGFMFCSDITDIEVTNIHNEVVTETKAKESLSNLFLSGLYTLLVKAEIHSVAQALSLLKDSLGLGTKFFSQVTKIFCQIVQAILPQIKRLITIFTVIIFVVIGISSLSSFSHLFFLPKARVAPLVLRC